MCVYSRGMGGCDVEWSDGRHAYMVYSTVLVDNSGKLKVFPVQSALARNLTILSRLERLQLFK